jgi:hypothetical protein
MGPGIGFSDTIPISFITSYDGNKKARWIGYSDTIPISFITSYDGNKKARGSDILTRFQFLSSHHTMETKRPGDRIF